MLHFFVQLWWSFQHFTGMDNVAGRAYGFWSGFGSDLGEITLIGLVAGIIKHQNCHVKGCKSVFTHPVVGTPFKVCKRHHPAMKRIVTHLDIVKAHRDATR